MPQRYFLPQTAPVPVRPVLAGTAGMYLEVVAPSVIVWDDYTTLTIPVFYPTTSNNVMVSSLASPGTYVFDGSKDAYLVLFFYGDAGTYYLYFIKRSDFPNIDAMLVTAFGAGTYYWGVLCQVEGVQIWPFPQAAGNSGTSLTVTDGTTTVTGVDDITFVGSVVSGSTPNATVTTTAGSLGIEAGAFTMTIVTGTADVTASVTFPIPYLVAPVVVCAGAGVSDADSTYICAAQSVTATTFTAKIETAVPVLADTTYAYSWHAVPSTPPVGSHSIEGGAGSAFDSHSLEGSVGT